MTKSSDEPFFSSSLTIVFNKVAIDDSQGRKSKRNYSTLHNNIGEVLADQGKYAKAIKSLEHALKVELLHLPSSYALLSTIHIDMCVWIIVA